MLFGLRKNKINPYFAKGNPHTEAWATGIINTKLYNFAVFQDDLHGWQGSLRADSTSPAPKFWIADPDTARKLFNLKCWDKTVIKTIYKISFILKAVT